MRKGVREGPQAVVRFSILQSVVSLLNAVARSLLARRDSNGIGAGLFGVLFPLIVADLTWGTAGSTCPGQASPPRYRVTIAGLSGVAGVRRRFWCLPRSRPHLVLFSLAMPETRDIDERVGFERVGVRTRLGQLRGVWRDVVLLERRSSVAG